jgi:feruloyl esterase
MEAQRFPGDFDGIIAGDPGYNWTTLMAFELWGPHLVTQTSGSALTKEKVATLASAVMAACDAKDGVKDGIISDPLACKFDPAVLKCRGADGPTCLTADQIRVVRGLYDGVRHPDGRLIYRGFARGTEATWTMYVGITDLNRQGGASARDFIQKTVMGDPTFDLNRFDFDHDVDITQERAGLVMDATSPDLSAFKARGGKLIHYHGWADGAPQTMIDYYRSVASKKGGLAKVEDFYRLFLAPGMTHCGGGVGPNRFEPIAALEAWSEKGVAPNSMVATRLDSSGKPDMTRPVCPWPKMTRYDGRGDTNAAQNFHCAVPR